MSSGYSFSRPLNLSVWIDYNRNGVFEISERIIRVSENSPTGSVNIGTQSFTVPTTAYSGDKILRMRVISKYDASDLTNPCGEIHGGGGGYMDFSVQISKAT